MTTSRFDTLIHAPTRLQICASLAAVAEIEFKVLRNHLDVSESVLSKQIKLLTEADYAISKKRAHNGRSYTWLSLSSNGRDAFTAHVEALKKIVG